MKNELNSIGPITIYGYGLMIAIGVLAAYFSATYRSKKYALDPDKVFYVTVWAVIGGFGGAKLLYLITQLPAIFKDPSLLKDARNGFVVYGVIIGGILAAWLYCKVAKLKFMKYFDLVMPSVALAQGFGRIGCFLAGCCYGKETNSAFHIIFHDSAYAPNNVPLIPTQLISSGLDFLNCIFLMWFAGKKRATDRWQDCIWFAIVWEDLSWNSSVGIWKGEMWEVCPHPSLSLFSLRLPAWCCFSGLERKRHRDRKRIYRKKRLCNYSAATISRGVLA